MILDKISATEKSLQTIASDRHGILYENIDSTQERIIRYLEELE